MSEPLLTFAERLAAERELLNGADFALPVVMGLAPMIAICGLLQLAMRHPGTKGSPSATISREFVAGIVKGLSEAGFIEHATLVQLGDNPANDQPAQ